MLIHFFGLFTIPHLPSIEDNYITLHNFIQIHKQNVCVLVAAQFYYTDLQKWFMSSDYTHLPSLHALSTKCWLLICT